MSAETPIPLAFPVPFPDIPSFLLHARISRKEMQEYLGPPMHTDWVDGMGEADMWAFEYPCGLKVVYKLLRATECARVVVDSPEIEHVRRHLPFTTVNFVPIDEAGLKAELQRLLSAFPERQAEIASMKAYQVWRQGTDGNPFTIGSPTSKRDAACWVQHFESLGHHQHYWYSKVSDNTQT